MYQRQVLYFIKKTLRYVDRTLLACISCVALSFKRDDKGGLTSIKVATANDEGFYEASRTYSLSYTCNSWANNALKAFGQRACLWTPFDCGIFDLYR